VKQTLLSAAGDGREHSERRLEKAPSSLKSPNPSTPAEPGAIERHGNWLILGRDATHKRVTCRCTICSHICAIGREALESGVVFCAGCAHPHSAKPAEPADSFAANVADLESWGARKRHRGAQ
jgi:hypothetical protein